MLMEWFELVTEGGAGLERSKPAARAQFFGDFSGFYIGGGAEDGGTGL
jgi:hypothetical protein